MCQRKSAIGFTLLVKGLAMKGKKVLSSWMIEKFFKENFKEKNMKKSLLVILTMMLGLILVGSAIAGLSPTSGITDSYHDLGTTAATYGDTGEQGGQNRICVYCHAPHNTIKLGSPEAVDGMGNPVEYLPLWNHAITDMAAYEMYSNGPLAPTTGDGALNAIMGQPTGVSILCLSCHDGSVATNAYGAPGTSSVGAGDKTMTGRALIGGLNISTGLGDLSNHHPISFDYAAADALDDEINPATTSMGTFGKTINDFLFGGSVECATCHDVHNGTEAVGVRLTYVDDDRSAFCLTCHFK